MATNNPQKHMEHTMTAARDAAIPANTPTGSFTYPAPDTERCTGNTEHTTGFNTEETKDTKVHGEKGDARSAESAEYGESAHVETDEKDHSPLPSVLSVSSVLNPVSSVVPPPRSRKRVTRGGPIGTMRLAAALSAGKLAAKTGRALKVGGGTSLPGIVARRIDPKVLRKEI